MSKTCFDQVHETSKSKDLRLGDKLVHMFLNIKDAYFIGPVLLGTLSCLRNDLCFSFTVSEYYNHVLSSLLL